MKKIFKSAFFVALGATMMLQSCGEEETEAPVRTGTATIKGTVSANINYLGDTPSLLEPATGAIVRVTYENEDLSYSGGEEYTIVKTATVGSDGSYSVSVDATNENIRYTVTVDQFVTNVSDSIRTQPASEQPKYAAGSFEVTFEESNNTINLTSGEAGVVNFTLGGEEKTETHAFFEAKNFND